VDSFKNIYQCNNKSCGYVFKRESGNWECPICKADIHAWYVSPEYDKYYYQENDFRYYKYKRKG